jgi:DNA-binding CsgD family transcriptional regulator
MAHVQRCAEALVDVVSDSVRALDDDRSVHEVMCRGVARVLNATIAAFVCLDAELQQCKVICWSAAQTWVALRYVTSETWPSATSQFARPSVWIWQHSLAFSIMRDLIGAVDYAEIPLGMHAREARLAVFARHEKFALDDIRFLDLCTAPLAAIEGHLHTLEAWRGDASTRTPYDGGGDGAGQLSRGLSVGLTKRELEVLALLKQGLKARTIAGRLGISPRTVNKHLGNTYVKLNAHDRLLAVERAQLLGILPRA